MSGKIFPLVYKGFPLMRQGNIIYYGNITDKFIIMIQIMDTKQVKDLDLSTKVSIQLQSTDPGVKSKDRVIKRSEKNGLYDAMDLASIWLNRALS